MTTITYEEFERVNLRSGTIVKVEEFARAKSQHLKYGQILGKKSESCKRLLR